MLLTTVESPDESAACMAGRVGTTAYTEKHQTINFYNVLTHTQYPCPVLPIAGTVPSAPTTTTIVKIDENDNIIEAKQRYTQ